MRVLVLKAPGTNCDMETADAFARLACTPDVVPIAELTAFPKRVHDYDIFVIPGGFSYGDDIAAGKVLALQLKHTLLDELLAFHDRGKFILGICNGFQALLKTGLLPGPSSSADAAPRVTLSYNDSGRFEDRWVRLRFDPAQNPLASALQAESLESLECPVAHAEGKVTVSSEADLHSLQDGRRLIIRYAHPDDPGFDAARSVLPYPHNPNGSHGNIAGFSDPSGRILGLMPHPERAARDYLHPLWPRCRAQELRFHAGLAFLRAVVAVAQGRFS